MIGLTDMSAVAAIPHGWVACECERRSVCVRCPGVNKPILTRWNRYIRRHLQRQDWNLRSTGRLFRVGNLTVRR